MSTIADRDLRVAGGRLRVRDYGGAGDLVVCIPGLSANLTAFDLVGERLANAGHHAVSVDLRGRGFSEVTAPGTYGWPAHARDVIDVVAQLGDGHASLVGHSMGAYVAMATAGISPEAARRLVLVDGLGSPERRSLPPIMAGVERLGVVHPSVEAYVGRVRALGVIEPWSELWERYFRYDLEPVPGGVHSRTDRGAVLEDAQWGADHPQRGLWAGVVQPTLLVLATRPIGDGGFIVSARDRDDFLRQAPHARGVEVDANHYGVVADEMTARHVADFLDASACG